MDEKFRQELRGIDAGLSKLYLFRDFLEEDLIAKFRNLLRAAISESNNIKDAYWDFQHGLINEAQRRGLKGDLWQSYIFYLLITSENPFSRTIEKLESKDISSNLLRGATHDMEIVRMLFDMDFRRLGNALNEECFAYMESLPGMGVQENILVKFESFKEKISEGSPEKMVEILLDFYYKYGCGENALNKVFRWQKNGGLVGIKYSDPITMEDLIGYSYQKRILMENTEAFLAGRKANNILLYGKRGTGKSSSIKALANKYFDWGLRLIEVPKHQLHYLPEILGSVRERMHRFIIFIDDLSFEGYETEYKYLKALLEGGVEVTPDNVLLYATSNRRHLVQEKWSDREERDEEIHAADSVEEKLSLVDRFGITITFTSPDQDEYLKIVEGIASRENIDIPLNELREKALQWEKWYRGRSGRSARQFVNYLLSL